MDMQSPVLHVADSRDLIRVQGAPDLTGRKRSVDRRAHQSTISAVG
jgi:hypothetical protein